MADYRRAMEDALAHQRKQAAVEIDRKILRRAAASASIADITVADLAEALADVLNAHKRELVEHLERRVKLVETKLAASSDDTRFRNLHRRLAVIESALRRRSGA